MQRGAIRPVWAYLENCTINAHDHEKSDEANKKTFVIRALPYDGQGSLRLMLQHTEPMAELASTV